MKRRKNRIKEELFKKKEERESESERGRVKRRVSQSGRVVSRISSVYSFV